MSRANCDWPPELDRQTMRAGLDHHPARLAIPEGVADEAHDARIAEQVNSPA